jgi:predicted secreted protein
LVERSEIPEPVHEHIERAHHVHGDGFRRLAAIYLGIVAMLLAISALGGGKATKDMLNANIRASDAYAFAQAKYLRQTAYELAADQLEEAVAAQPAMPDAAKTAMTASVERYRTAAAHYASDPASGEGRKELLERAKHWDEERDHASARDPNFEFSSALFQIAIVLGSVAIVATSRALLGLSAVLTVCATALAINGFFLLVHLPSIG